MKHGPNALIDEELRVVVVCTRDETSKALEAVPLRKSPLQYG